MDKHCFITGCAGLPQFGYGTVRGQTLSFACSADKELLWGSCIVPPAKAVGSDNTAGQGRLL